MTEINTDLLISQGLHSSEYVCVFVCVYACMHACMFVCM